MCQSGKSLDFYSRLDRKSIIYLLYQREFGIKEKENQELLQSNIKNLSIHYLHLLGNNASRAAAMLTQKLTLKRASEISRLPESTISWGRSQINQGMLYFEFQEMKVNDVVQKLIQKEEIEWFESWILSISPVRSGSLKERRIPYNSYTEFFKVYLTEASNRGFPSRSLTTIINWIKRLGIKRCKFDKYTCDICYKGRKAEVDPNRDKNPHYIDYLEHRSIVDNQFACYKKQRENINQEELMVIYDYSTVHEYSVVEKIRNLSFMVATSNNTFFLDYLATAPHDYHFTSSAWNIFILDLQSNAINLSTFKKIIVWSYGGLKTKENICYFSELSSKLNLQIELNYFGPYHGHNEVMFSFFNLINLFLTKHKKVDAHFGRGKMVLRRLAVQRPIQSKEEVVDAFSQVSKVAKLIDVKKSEMEVMPFKKSDSKMV